MDKAYPPEAWKRLGEELQRRRGRLGYGFRRRGDFLADCGGQPSERPSEKTLARLERGERGSYPPATLARLEALYEYAPGSFEAILAGGEGTPLGAPPAPPLRAVPAAPSPPPGSPAEQVLAGLLAAYPDDRVVTEVLGSQFQEGKEARVIVNEILEWLDFLRSKGRLPERGSSAGLRERNPKGMVKIAPGNVRSWPYTIIWCRYELRAAGVTPSPPRNGTAAGRRATTENASAPPLVA